MIEGRWVDKFFEWACPRCRHVLQALQAPRNDAEAICRRCNVDDMSNAELKAAADRLPEVKAERDEALTALRAEQQRADRLALRVQALEADLAAWKGRAA